MLPSKPQDLGSLDTSVYHSSLRVAEDQHMGWSERTANLVDTAVCGRLRGLSDILDTKDLSERMHSAAAILLLHPEQGFPFPLASICSTEKTVTANSREEVLSPPSIPLKLSSLIYPLGCCYKLIKQDPHSLTLKVSQPLISYYPSCSSTCWLLQINGRQRKYRPGSQILIKYRKVVWFVSTMPYSNLYQLRFKCRIK